jgi:hypothetical protein
MYVSRNQKHQNKIAGLGIECLHVDTPVNFDEPMLDSFLLRSLVAVSPVVNFNCEQSNFRSAMTLNYLPANCFKGL